MSRSVEGDVLVDTCRFYPIPQGLAGHAFLEAFKHFARSRFAHQFDGFLTKRKGGWCIGLLSTEDQTQTDTAHFTYMFPSQVVHVAEAESGQTRKERGTFQYFNFARGLCQLNQFLLGQELAFHLFPFDVVQVFVDVFSQQLLLVSHLQEGPERREVAGCGILRELLVRTFQLMRMQEVFPELHAEVHGHFSEGTFPSREYQEVLIDNAPFLVLSARDLFKVAEEVLLQLVMVEETELAVNHRLLSAASDEFRFSSMDWLKFRSTAFLGMPYR